MNLEVSLLGNTLENPFVLASGPLSYSAEGIIKADRAGAGAIVTKTIRQEAAENPTPHIVESDNNSLINAEKWSDLPPERWIEEELPRVSDISAMLFASIGHTAGEVESFVEPVEEAGADGFELVSYDRNTLLPMVEKARSITNKPVLVKVSPNWDSPVETALEALEAGGSGVTVMDSLGPVLKIDIEKESPLLGSENGTGWLSGEAINPLMLRYVAQIASSTEKPIIATGGITSAEDAMEALMAGAAATGLCSAAILKGVEYFGTLRQDMEDLMNSMEYETPSEVTGAALKNVTGKEHSNELSFKFDENKCINCGRCVTVCSYDARSLENGKMELSKERCRHCGLCVSVCPTEALTHE
jgi:dihydropyrimidine dehydrogenase (NAD+) subunit PreA